MGKLKKIGKRWFIINTHTGVKGRSFTKKSKAKKELKILHRQMRNRK